MSAVVGYHPAYAPDIAPDDNPARRAGMILLGKWLLSEVTGGPTIDKLQSALSKAQNTDGVDLRIENSEPIPGGRPLKLGPIPGANGNFIKCPLVDDNGTAPVDAGELWLEFKKDTPPRSGGGANRKITMNVVFPEQADNANNSVYLASTAKDTVAINTASGNADAAKYLAAFKFLSRCK